MFTTANRLTKLPLHVLSFALWHSLFPILSLSECIISISGGNYWCPLSLKSFENHIHFCRAFPSFLFLYITFLSLMCLSFPFLSVFFLSFTLKIFPFLDITFLSFLCFHFLSYTYLSFPFCIFSFLSFPFHYVLYLSFPFLCVFPFLCIYFLSFMYLSFRSFV